MKKERKWSLFVIQLLTAATILLLVSGCGQTDELSEFEGIVIAKRAPVDLLVVPNVDPTALQNMTEAELLTLAETQNGIYFSVDRTNFENVTIGHKVVIHYDPSDGEEVSTPPRRHSQRMEIVTD
jgi:hypothetical protein